MIAVPTHSETVTVQTAATLVQFTRLLERRGARMSLEWFSGSVISEVRNALTSAFIHSGADRMFMLDSDQGLPADLLVRLLDSDKDVLGCMYPKRRLDWSKAARPVTTLETATYQASEFVGELVSKRDDVLQFDVVEGFARALHVGGGALMIRRGAIDRLMARYPELQGRGYESRALPEEKFQHNWGFFNHLDAGEAGRALAEDYAFCHRWRVGCGGEIWADVTADTQHVGRYVYSGNYLAYARARFGETPAG